jgi:hypothetical protein
MNFFITLNNINGWLSFLGYTTFNHRIRFVRNGSFSHFYNSRFPKKFQEFRRGSIALRNPPSLESETTKKVRDFDERYYERKFYIGD